ncbi:MAG: hypothetical protein ACE3JK_13270 [Sporolactobacillus sp.]
MTALWIVFNFVLILLAFYLILHLYQRIRLLQQSHAEDIAKEIEAAFDVYLEDIKAENAHFAEQLKQMLQEQRTPAGRKNTRKKVQPTTAKNEDVSSEIPAQDAGRAFRDVLTEQASYQKKSTDNRQPAASVDWVPPTDQITDALEESPALQAMNLQKKGLSVTEIARKLGRGEGEIQLLLKFQEKR